MNRHPSGRWAQQVRFGLVVALIVSCFLWGGGSRLDIPGLIFLQPLAVIVAVALTLVPGEIRWAAVRVPLLLLGGLATIMIIQLIPLPPAIWNALPGHGQLGVFTIAARSAADWRPLSLTPDLTLASLVGLSVPAAALIGFASLQEDKTHRIMICLLCAAGVSVIFGLAQLASGAQSGFYRYAVTNNGAAVGLFSNRNHQAVFLTMVWPMLALWATQQGLSPQQRNLRRWVAWTSALALIPMVTVTGSRAGLALSLIGVASGWWLLRAEERRSPQSARAPHWLRRGTPVLTALAVVAMGGLAAFLSRAEAIKRMLETNVAEELRFNDMPTLLRIAGDFLPFGTGFGSFDPVFRFYEPDQLLTTTYLNHAHNDLLELVITGGLPAVAVLLVFAIWALRRAPLLKGRIANSVRERYAFVGLAMIILLLLASLVDYPMRTPVHAMLFAFAAGWLAAPPNRAGQSAAG